MISEYRFGRIVIDGVVYTSDVVIYPSKVHSNWWRVEGHLLQYKDIQEVVKEAPDTLVIGTGAYGLMKVPGELKRKLESNGISVIVEPTEGACKRYNEACQGGKRVIAALHLTC